MTKFEPFEILMNKNFEEYELPLGDVPAVDGSAEFPPFVELTWLLLLVPLFITSVFSATRSWPSLFDMFPLTTPSPPPPPPPTPPVLLLPLVSKKTREVED